MTVLNRKTGKELHWDRKPISPRQKVRWSRDTMYGKPVLGSMRTICHFDRLNHKAMRRFGVHFTIIQPPYNTTVAASAGTHDFDCCVDWYLPGVDWWTAQRWGRANGLGCWYRHPPAFSQHLHGFTLPALRHGQLSWSFSTKVGIYVPGQLYDYYKHAFGLSGQHTPYSDKSWFPKDIASTVFNLGDFIHDKRAA
jgi:hypothetical protein